MGFSRPWLLPITLIVAVWPLSAQVASAVTQAAQTITPAEVARHISVLAADSMMGRGTPSPGLEMAGRYVAGQFKRFGLTPGGEGGSWLQRYPHPLPRDTLATAPNTIGMLEGSDPKLKREYIVFLAHMDHLGVNPALADSIYNGADDNASGVAGILELAEAFSRPGARPRRSLIFLTVSGHNTPNSGSIYFASHPSVPIEQIVATINLDMISRNWTDKILAVSQNHSELGVILQRVVAAHPELRMTVISDSIWPRSRGFLGGWYGDHYAFYDSGIPGVSFFNDYHVDFQQVTDTPDAIDAEKASRVVRLAFYLGQATGNAAKRPAWTEAGNRFRERLAKLKTEP